MYDKYQAAMVSNYGAVAIAAPQQSLEHAQREALAMSASTLRHGHREKLQESFGVSDMKTPTNAQEMIDRIKAGEYTLTEEYTRHLETDLFPIYNMTYGIRWRKPDTKYDRDGFDAAVKLLDKAYEQVVREVWIIPLTDALKSLNTFEEQTFN